MMPNPVRGLPDLPTGDLLEAKLFPPSLHHEHVSRPRLLRRLNSITSRALTLIGAPAGFGKSTLLAEWCAGLPLPARFAWLTLDADDNDPVVFWSYVVHALRRLELTSFASALALLNRPAVNLSGAVLPALINELWTLPDNIVVVLDDYHEVTNFDCHESLAFLLSQLPPSVHIVIATRADPPLPLGGMRAKGDLSELRAADLRFNEAEVAQWLNDRLGLHLTSVELEHLTQRTEGWPAGIYLAALSLRDCTDVDAFIAALSGGHHHFVEYLAGEVLDRISKEERDFLLQTSILETLTVPLCDAITGRTDAADLLMVLERTNQFLIQLDDRREKYRYHQLFRELLQLELQRTAADLIPELHRRAAAWFRDAGSVSQAMRHALAAADYELAESLLLSNIGIWMNAGNLETVAEWLRQFPEGVLAGSPRLALIGAWVSGMLMAPPLTIEHCVSLAQANRGSGSPVHADPTLDFVADVVRASFPVDDAERALTLAETIVAAADESGAVAPLVTHTALGLSLYLNGRAADAQDALRGALASAYAEHLPLVASPATAVLAMTRLAQGDAIEAEQLARQAVAIMTAAGLQRYPSLWLVWVAEGQVLVREGRLAEAEAVLAQGLEPHLERLRAWPLFHALALLALVPVRHGRGHLVAARTLLEEARAAVRGCRDAGMLPGLVAETERSLGRAVRRQTGLREELSEGELRVLRLLASELTQREIGRELYLSVNTVKSHTRAIYAKLDAASRLEAVAQARSVGLVA